ncbi:hypothetical protein CDD83_6306 [Cordyceps sp. RAO-2017]|nr:hypothetical protein CDD83_6306 [Cordyceps sp. RAO-2017]
MFSAFLVLMYRLAQLARGDTLAIDRNFPDPSIVKDRDGAWYAFATNDGERQVQVQAARATSPAGPWEVLDVDLLPDSGGFFTGNHTWAPDVRLLDDGSYVLYFSGQVRSDPAHHCVGVAFSSRIIGPYRPRPAPLLCDLGAGGQIDPAGFRDFDGRRYVTYKVDGNSLGRGGECNNGREPRVSTPIMLQELAANGVDKIGPPVQLLDRVGDEPLVEAPDIYRHPDGTYFLFFSAGCFSEPDYRINYATARNVRGPYTRARSSLLSSQNTLGLVAPGGATVSGADEMPMVFHANCPAGRCMHVQDFRVEGRRIRL